MLYGMHIHYYKSVSFKTHWNTLRTPRTDSKQPHLRVLRSWNTPRTPLEQTQHNFRNTLRTSCCNHPYLTSLGPYWTSQKFCWTSWGPYSVLLILQTGSFLVKEGRKTGAFFSKNTGVRRAKRRAKFKFLY